MKSAVLKNDCSSRSRSASGIGVSLKFIGFFVQMRPFYNFFPTPEPQPAVDNLRYSRNITEAQRNRKTHHPA
jgi:hypothetical protein